jgi:hypothetical protein
LRPSHPLLCATPLLGCGKDPHSHARICTTGRLSFEQALCVSLLT